MERTEKLWRVGRKQGRKRPTRRATRNTLGRIARSGDRIGTGQPSCGLPLTVRTVDIGATRRCRIVGAQFARRTQNGSGVDSVVARKNKALRVCQKLQMRHAGRWNSNGLPTVNGACRRIYQSGKRSRSAERVDCRNGMFVCHVDCYAIIATKSQEIFCDNRFCDNRTVSL